SRHTLPSHLSFEIVTLAVTKDQTCRRSTHRVRHRCAPSLKRRSIQCNELQFQMTSYCNATPTRPDCATTRRTGQVDPSETSLSGGRRRPRPTRRGPSGLIMPTEGRNAPRAAVPEQGANASVRPIPVEEGRVGQSRG